MQHNGCVDVLIIKIGLCNNGIRLYGQMSVLWHEAKLAVKSGSFVLEKTNGSHMQFKSVGMVERRSLKCFGQRLVKSMVEVTWWLWKEMKTHGEEE